MPNNESINEASTAPAEPQNKAAHWAQRNREKSMNCGCIKRLEGELAEAPFVKAKAGENIKVSCAATGFQMTDEMDLKLVVNIPFRVRGTGKGFTSEKGKELPVVASFCPFCGVSTKKAPAA